MNIVVKPIITEHSLGEAGKGRFSFVVAKGSTKNEIKKALEKEFSVNVVKIETASTPSRTYRAGKSRVEKKTTRGKKAIVTLKSGQKIDLFEVGSDA